MEHENTSRQIASHSYRLPVEDQEFLLRDELRGIRFALEYSKTDLLLRDWGIRSTIIVFGSARVPSPEQAEALRAGALNGGDEKAAARRLSLAPYYEEARKFGRIVSLQGGALNPKSGIRDNVIATGGGPGIMEAANRGASEVGAPTIGFNISLPHEQEPNPYTTPELTFRFHYFAMRKMHLAMRATGGTVGQAMVKKSSTNYDTEWKTLVPTGGSTGQALVKTSSSDYAAAWTTLTSTTPHNLLLAMGVR